jgi:hypothetical protein
MMEQERAYQPGPGAVFRGDSGAQSGPPLSATIEGNLNELRNETSDLGSLVVQLKQHLLGDMHLHPPRNTGPGEGQGAMKPPDHGLLGNVLTSVNISLSNVRGSNADLRRILAILRGE